MVKTLGQKVGDYILEKELGSGGFSTVYGARHEILDERVALKIFHDSDAIENLLREAKALYKLNHPHIVKLKTVSLNTSPPFVAMQWIEGQSLRELLKTQGSMPWAQVIGSIKGLFRALAHAHKQGLVHGDIKPENILIEASGKAYLTDFGLASSIAGQQDSLKLSEDLQDAQSRHGTFDYASPEQLKGEKPDARSDLYSMGLVLFEMISGQRPQPGDRPSHFDEDLPAAFDDLFARCFCRRKRRLKSADDALSMLSGLEDLVHTVPHPKSDSGPAIKVSSVDQVPTIQEPAPGANSDPLIGRVFGNCQVEQRLGAGGMGAVYLARHQHLDKTVCLKVMLPSKADPEGIERFQREARTAARLEHPNIVTMHDFGRSEDMFYLIMSHIEGKNLQEYLSEKKRLSIPETLWISLEIAKGLNAAHEIGLVHRDIKPANILISDKKEVQIVDFGLAKAVAHDHKDTGLTATGVILGTPAYMAPEQCSGEPDVDGRADLFALGLMMYSMISGKLPVAGKTPLQIVSNRLQKDIPALSSVHSEVTADVENLVMALLRRDRDRRLGPASKVVQRLEAFSQVYPYHAKVSGRHGVGSVRKARIKPQKHVGRNLVRARGPSSQVERHNESVRVREDLREQNQIEKDINLVERLISAGNFEAAGKKLEELEKSYPGDKEIEATRKSLADTEQLYNNKLESSEQKANDGFFNESFQALAQLAEAVPNSAEVQGRLEKLGAALEKRESLLNQARHEFQKGYDLPAVEICERCFEFMPEDRTTQSLIDEIKRNGLRVERLKQEAQSELKRGQCLEAIKRIDEALGVMPGKDELTELRHLCLRRWQTQQSRRKKLQLLAGLAVVVLVAGGVMAGLRASSMRTLKRAQRHLEKGKLVAAQKAYERSLKPFAFLLPQDQRELLLEQIDAGFALKKAVSTPGAAERLAKLEAFRKDFPNMRIKEVNGMIHDAKVQKRDDDAFQKVLDVEPAMERVNALRKYLNQSELCGHRQQATTIMQTLLANRQKALDGVEVARTQKDWRDLEQHLQTLINMGVSGLETQLKEAQGKKLRRHELTVEAAKLRKAGQLDEAVKLYKEAQGLGEDIADSIKEIEIQKAYKNLQISQRRGDHKDVIAYLKRLRELGWKRFSESNLKRAQAREAAQRANDLSRDRKYKEAIAAYEEADSYNTYPQYAYAIKSLRRRIKQEEQAKARTARRLKELEERRKRSRNR